MQTCMWIFAREWDSLCWRCAAAHEGNRLSHFCIEHGSPLKRNLDVLEAAAINDFSGAEDVVLDTDIDIDTEFASMTALCETQSAGEMDSDA